MNDEPFLDLSLRILHAGTCHALAGHGGGNENDPSQLVQRVLSLQLLHILTSTSGWLIPENQEAALDTMPWSLTLDVGFAASLHMRRKVAPL